MLSNKHAVSTGYGIPADDGDPFLSSYQSGYMLPNGDVVHDKHGSSDYVDNSCRLGEAPAPDPDPVYDFQAAPKMSYTFEHEGYGALADLSGSTSDSLYRYYEEDEDEAVSASSGNAVASQGSGHLRRSETLSSDLGDGLTDSRNSFWESFSVGKEASVVTPTEYANSQLGSINSAESAINPSDSDFYSEHTYHTPLVKKKFVGTASTALVAWNLLNLILSNTLLALPFAVASGGYAVYGFLVLIAVLTTYTSRILISMMYEKSERSQKRKVRVRLDYAELAQDALNSANGALLVRVIQILEMFTICVLNICVLGGLCHEMIPGLSVKACTGIVALVALPTFFIRHLAVIGWLQTIGVFSLAIGLILVQGYCLANGGNWKLSNIPMYKLDYMPIAVGIVIYAFGIQGVMPGLEQQMKKPSRFGFVVHLAFFIAFLIQVFFSFSNASLYGSMTSQVITVDLQRHFGLGIASACFIGISILCRFSLPTFVVMETLDQAVYRMFSCCDSRRDSWQRCFTSFSLRIFIMGLAAGVAIVLPYFAYLMGLVGSSITVLVSLIIPCLLHLKLRRAVMSFCQIFLDVLILLFGFACMGLGTFYSAKAIYYDAKDDITDI